MSHQVLVKNLVYNLLGHLVCLPFLLFFLAMVFFYSFSFRSDQRRIFVNEAFDNSAMDNAGEAWE